jgi:hypothetical protein
MSLVVVDHGGDNDQQDHDQQVATYRHLQRRLFLSAAGADPLARPESFLLLLRLSNSVQCVGVGEEKESSSTRSPSSSSSSSCLPPPRHFKLSPESFAGSSNNSAREDKRGIIDL